MQVVRITTESELKRLRPHWNRLAGDVPFRCWQWLHPWWRHYGSGRELYVLAVYDCQNVLRGVAPWMLDTSLKHGRALRFLGSGEVCSDYLSILTDKHHADQVTAVLADWLTQNARRQNGADPDHGWDVLELSGVDAEDHAAQRLIAHLRSCGNAVHCRSGPRCWAIQLPGTWDEYLALLSKSHRKKLRRLERGGLHGPNVRTCRADRDQPLQAGLEILVDLHQRRRQALGEPGCFSSPRFSGFLHETAAALAAEDRLRLYWIESEGQPIAVEFQLVGDNQVYAYQAGMAPDRLDLQPGRLSCIAGIQNAISEGLSQFDFLRGDEPYKAQWGATPRPSLFVRVAPRKPLALARHVTWLAGRRAKDVLKEGWAAMRARRSPSPERAADTAQAPGTNGCADPTKGRDTNRMRI